VAVVFACVVFVAPASAQAAAPPASQTGAEPVTSSTLVASEAPVPQHPVPRIGPFRGSAEVRVRAARWLLLLGGVQVVALMVVTRRARSRVSERDVEP
jgi:hypothetical protein